jgi:hypothetical protein
MSLKEAVFAVDRDGYIQMANWDYSYLPECVENLRAWQDESDGVITWELNRDLNLILDWFLEASDPVEMHRFGRVIDRG